MLVAALSIFIEGTRLMQKKKRKEKILKQCYKINNDYGIFGLVFCVGCPLDVGLLDLFMRRNYHHQETGRQVQYIVCFWFSLALIDYRVKSDLLLPIYCSLFKKIFKMQKAIHACHCKHYNRN